MSDARPSQIGGAPAEPAAVGLPTAAAGTTFTASRFLRDYFAAAAERELISRQKHYPGMIERGRITREEADADTRAWRAIADLFGRGEAVTGCSWAELEHATSKALLSCEAKLDAKPDSQSLLARRDAVWGIHERITWEREARVRPLNAERMAA